MTPHIATVWAKDPVWNSMPRKRDQVIEVEVQPPEAPSLFHRPLGPHEYALVGWSEVRDPELVGFAQQIKPPEKVFDEVLGELTFDRQFRAFELDRDLGSARYKVDLKPIDAREPHTGIRAGREFVLWFESELPSIQRDTFLSLKHKADREGFLGNVVEVEQLNYFKRTRRVSNLSWEEAWPAAASVWFNDRIEVEISDGLVQWARDHGPEH